MATRFVSNTTSNGYTAGADSGTALTKGAPWLTITFALSTANAGDTITVNGGTYSETAFLNPGKINFILTSDGSVVVQTSNGADTKVLSLRSAATGFVLNTGFTFDAQGVQATSISSDGSGGTFVLHGPQVIGYTAQGIALNPGIFTLDQGWTCNGNPTSGNSFGMLLQGTSTSIPSVFNISNGTVAPTNPTTVNVFMGIRATTNANCSCTCIIHDVVVTVTANTGNAFLYGITPNSNRLNSSIYNNTINLTTTVSSGVSVRGIYLLSNGNSRCYNNIITLTAPAATTDNIQAFIVSQGTTTIATDETYIEGNIITIVGTTTSTSAQGIRVDNIPTAGIVRSIIISNNLVTIPAGSGNSSGGVGIKLGTDSGAPATKNTLGYSLVSGNIVNGGSIGILIGSVNNVTTQYNILYNCGTGIRERFTNQTTTLPCRHYKNLVYALQGTSGSAFENFGANGTIWDGNFYKLDVNSQAIKFFNCNADPTAPTPSTTCVFRNNILLGLGNAVIAATCASNTDATSSCTFTNNDYFALGSFAASAWNYQGVSYSTLAAWIAAVEATAIGTDPRKRTFGTRTFGTRTFTTRTYVAR